MSTLRLNLLTILFLIFGDVLSRVKKRKEPRKRKETMPVTGAGLIRFFEEETYGIKIKPKYVVLMAVGFITLVMILWARPLLPF